MRIELPGGGWWDIKDDLTVGDEEYIEEAESEESHRSMSRFQASGIELGSLMTTGGARDGKPTTEAAKVTLVKKNATVLVGTVGWSFPEPVSGESLRERTKRDRDTVWNAMVRLHGLDETQEAANAGKDSFAVLSSSPNGM